MIVSVTISDNRESEIGEALQSVVDHVDRVLVIDTGITDKTLWVANGVAGDKLKAVKHDWIDFSTARNAGIEEAIKLDAEWILIVDTDERLHLRGIDLRTALAKARSDILSFESDDGHYPKDKILRASSSARFVGPTHETLVGGSREPLPGATFSELPKSALQLKRKFARDVRLLLDYVAEHPQDPRWWYYLGASYEGIAELAEKAFGECVTKRKSGHEAAWAAYKQAETLLSLERFEETIQAASRGMVANPTSAECAYVAARAALKLGRPDQAIAWARIAEAVGLYKGCGKKRAFFRHLPAHYELPYDVLCHTLTNETERLQAEVDFYEAKQARELAATAEYLDRLSGLDLDLMSVSRESSEVHRHGARIRLRSPLLESLCPSTKLARIKFNPPNGWHPTNPNLCWHQEKLWCVVRTVNYLVRNGRYFSHDSDGVIRTENYLGLLLPDNEVDVALMRDFDSAPRQKSNIVGYEDVRLVSVNGKLTASATVCDRDSSRRQIAKLTLSLTGDVIRADIQPSNQLHEKNWMPLTVDGKFTYIYSLDPIAVLPGPLRDCPFALEHLKGGAITPYLDGYLCVTHETLETPQGRIYLHRFVKLDSKFYVIGVSRAWVFAHYGIEFAAGLVQDGEELVLSYGIDDREAWIARINANDVEEMEWFLPDEPDEPKAETQPIVTGKLHIAVVNSSHERCGVREYGDQLNRALARAHRVEPHTHENISVDALTRADVVLVHFENGLIRKGFREKISAAKRHGARIIFCCHNYESERMRKFLPFVDRFVLHRFYANAPKNSVEIPLGCPVYKPGDREAIRSKLGLPQNKIIVTSLGFLAAWKRWPEVLEAIVDGLSDTVFLQIHTPAPFSLPPGEFARESAKIRSILGSRGRHTTEFLQEQELLDRVYASDLGFLFHPIHTNSVSAATKQFVSGRCPLVVTGSSHASDLRNGVVRVGSFNPNDLAKEIRRVVTDNELRARMTIEMAAEYDRLNIDRTAEKYTTLFKEILS